MVGFLIKARTVYWILAREQASLRSAPPQSRPSGGLGSTAGTTRRDHWPYIFSSILYSSNAIYLSAAYASDMFQPNWYCTSPGIHRQTNALKILFSLRDFSLVDQSKDHGNDITRLLVHSGTWASLPAHLSCLEHFVAEQKVGRNSRTGSNGISENTEGIVDALQDGIHWLTRLQVKSHNIALGFFVL